MNLSPAGDHLAGVSAARSGLVVAVHHLVSEPLGLQFSRLFPTCDRLIGGQRGEQNVLGVGEETGKSSLLSPRPLPVRSANSFERTCPSKPCPDSTGVPKRGLRESLAPMAPTCLSVGSDHVAESGEGNGNPLQYSCPGDPTDRGAWWATHHGVAKTGHDRITKHSCC